MNFWKKYIKSEIIYSPEKAIISFEFFKIKIKHKVLQPLFNKAFCKYAGIKTLLIVRFDGIGDYILTRSFFKDLRKSEKYKDYKIIFAGRPEFVELAKKYDCEYIDYFVSANIVDLAERKAFIKRAKKWYVDCVINPYGSKLRCDIEKLVSRIKANIKICNYDYFSECDKKYNPKLVNKVLKKYNKVISTSIEPIFVWECNRLFFEKIISESINEISDLCDLESSEKKFLIPSCDYILVSPFANSASTYSPENFVKIINFVNKKYNIPVIILGTFAEKERAQNIRNMCSNPNMVYNFAGKFSISETCLFIKNAKLLIANETGTVHIAKNFKTKTVCISNGSYMFTFWPYSTPFMHYVYPDNMEEILKNKINNRYLAEYDINNIPPEKVMKKVEEIML